MRVIAGLAKRVPLKTPEGLETRPTTDRIKETLFNMLQPYLADCTFLDLFSGSGAIGIEALSRGAKRAVLVEQGRQPLACIQENLKSTRLEEKAEVLGIDVIQALSQLNSQKVYFDIIFMDPPYGCNYEKMVLEYLETSKLIDEDSFIIFEAALNTDLSYIENMNFTIDKIKKYKTNMHVFVSHKG